MQLNLYHQNLNNFLHQSFLLSKNLLNCFDFFRVKKDKNKKTEKTFLLMKV